MAYLEDDPLRATDALRRGLVIAQESGNRANETYLAMAFAMALDRIEVEPGNPLVALDNISLAVSHYYDAGNTTQLRAALGLLTTFLDRHGHNESAAIIAGFACVGPMAAPTVPGLDTATVRLCDVLGDQTYESLVLKGEAMTTATAVAYAYDQIDQARAELNAVSK